MCSIPPAILDRRHKILILRSGLGAPVIGAPREGANDEEISAFIRSVVNDKEEGHRINEADFAQPMRTMVYIGG